MQKVKETIQLNHDIKSLIMSIKAYIQLTSRTLTHTKEKKSLAPIKSGLDYLKRADAQIDKLTALIDQV